MLNQLFGLDGKVVKDTLSYPFIAMLQAAYAMPVPALSFSLSLSFCASLFSLCACVCPTTHRSLSEM